MQHCWGWGWVKTSWEVFGSGGLSSMNRPMSFYILVWCCEVDFLLCFALFLPFFVGWYKETTFQSLELWDNISNKIPNFNYFVMKHASTSSFHLVFLTSVFLKKWFFKNICKSSLKNLSPLLSVSKWYIFLFVSWLSLSMYTWTWTHKDACMHLYIIQFLLMYMPVYMYISMVSYCIHNM